jgi:hypothetical protein
MEVDLTLQDIEPFVQPGYAGIAVIGVSRGSVPQEPAPYQASIPLAGITGIRGVIVVGATRAEKKEVPSGMNPVGDCREWVAMRRL